MNTLKPFPKILHKLSTNDSQEESQKMKDLQSTHSIKLSLSIIILASLYFLVFFIVYKQYENVLWMTLALLFCLLSWLFCEKLKNFFNPIFFLFCLASSVYSSYLFGKLAHYGFSVTFAQGFVLGYLNGFYEKMICTRFPNFIFRVSFSLITTLARLIFIQDALIEFQVYQVYIVFISLMIDFFQEKDDKRFSQEFHEERESLTQFRNLASSGLSGNLLILTKNFHDKLFISDPLCEMIERVQQGGFSFLLQWLDSLKIERHTFKDITRANSSSMTQNEQDQSVLAILQEMQNEASFLGSQQKLRFNAKIQDDATQKIFEVKVHTTIWDDKDAFVLVFNDITDHYLNTNLQSLADQNKDKMLAMITHELRTPLNGILGVVNILKKDIKEPQQLRYLTVCHNSGELLLNLVNSILDLQQIRDHKFSLKFAKEDLYDLIGGVYDLFKFQFDQKDLFLKFEISPGVPEQIVTDKNRLKQILINLIGNALKFTFSGGVSVLVDLDPVLPGYIHFRVSDTGIGIKEEDLKNLFKMYGKLEQEDAQTNTQGIGFGLEISNQLAKVLAEDEEAGGIKVESQVSQGTTFSFSIRDNLFNSLNSEESYGGGINYYEPRVFSENIEDVGIKMTPYLPRNIYTNDRTSPAPAVSRLVSIAENLMPSVSLFRLQRTSILAPPLNLPAKSLNNLKLPRSYNNLHRSRGNLSPHHNNQKDYSFSDLSPVSIAQNKSWTSNRPKVLIVDDNPFNPFSEAHSIYGQLLTVLQNSNKIVRPVGFLDPSIQFSRINTGQCIQI